MTTSFGPLDAATNHGRILVSMMPQTSECCAGHILNIPFEVPKNVCGGCKILSEVFCKSIAALLNVSVMVLE
ncbi:unnamed protein product [Bathycoccus prasinos]